MRVWEIQGQFGFENLKPAKRPDPTCGRGQVRVAIGAMSLNYRDVLMVRGLYNPKLKLPLIPMSDGVGTIVEVGPGVTGFKEGDRVAGCFVQGWIAGMPQKWMTRTTLGGPVDGMLAEQIVLPETGVVKVPEHLTVEEAATLPCAALTAWSAMAEFGRVRAGDTVLVQGTGGVSVFALQLAKTLGARVICTSSSDEKLQRAKELGADDGINYKTEESWGKAAKELSGGDGVDLVIEVGGAGTLAQSLLAIRPGGTISLIGNLTGLVTDINLAQIFMRNVTLQGVLVGHREGFVNMNRAIAQHGLKPVIDRVFDFDAAPAAFEHMASGDHFGKICIRVG